MQEEEEPEITSEEPILENNNNNLEIQDDDDDDEQLDENLITESNNFYFINSNNSNDKADEQKFISNENSHDLLINCNQNNDVDDEDKVDDDDDDGRKEVNTELQVKASNVQEAVDEQQLNLNSHIVETAPLIENKADDQKHLPLPQTTFEADDIYVNGDDFSINELNEFDNVKKAYDDGEDAINLNVINSCGELELEEEIEDDYVIDEYEEELEEDDDDDNTTESDVEMIEAFDDRDGCRSLICDASGIIVAEMVYRCMICANISESVNEAQKHYQLKHILCENVNNDSNNINNLINRKNIHNNNNNRNTSNINSSSSNSKNNLLNEYDQYLSDANDLEYTINSNNNYSRTYGNSNANNDNNKYRNINKNYNENGNKVSTITYNVPSSLKQLQQQINPSAVIVNSINNVQRKRNTGGNERAINSGLNTNNTRNVQTNSRGGFVTCTVCNITKFYASVQRRYGQFTCMGCAKFFGRFLLKPRTYYCPNLGSCPLDTSPRCKACLLLGCIKTYTIDQERMKIVNAYRPVKKVAPGDELTGAKMTAGTTSITIGQVSLKPILPANECTNDFLNSEDKEEIVINVNPLQTNFSLDNGNNNNNNSTLLSTLHDVSTKFSLTSTPVNTFIGTSEQMKLSAKNSLTITSLKKSVKNLNGINNKTTPPTAASVKTTGRKLTGCRSCPGCLAEDCGQCHYCKDKPKYGGPNTLKKKCIQKRCSIFEATARQRGSRNQQSKTGVKRKL